MRHAAPFQYVSAALLSLALGACAFASEDAKTMNKALDKTHANITRSYADVPHINAHSLTAMKEDSYVVFDVREKDEFTVSHLEDAIWIDPDIKAEDFYSAYGEKISGKTVVLYCSVGVRSSRLAQDLMSSLAAQHSTSIYNLEKGIFGWHNENRPLMRSNSESETDFIHPYNRLWGRMVNRKDLRRYEEQAKSDE